MLEPRRLTLEGVHAAVCEQDDDASRVSILVFQQLPSLFDCQGNVGASIHARLAQAGHSFQMICSKTAIMQLCNSSKNAQEVCPTHHLIQLPLQLIQLHVLWRDLNAHIVAELHHRHLCAHMCSRSLPCPNMETGLAPERNKRDMTG